MTSCGREGMVSQEVKAIVALKKGVHLLKCGRRGKPKFCPFRLSAALKAIQKLQECVDTLILIPNDRLLDVAPVQTPLQQAFLLVDDDLRQGVQDS